MPFKPGVSGNPGGKPKGVRQRCKDAVKKYGVHPLDFFAQVMASKKEKTADRIVAGKELLNRLYGKAPQYIENKIDGAGDNEITIKIVDTNDTSAGLIEVSKKEDKGDNVIDITPTGTDSK